MRHPMRLTIALGLSLYTALLLTACAHHAEPDRTGVLAPLGPDVSPSPYRPTHPMLPIAEGVVGRTVAQAASGRGYRIEVREFSVGPGRRFAAPLQAAGVIEVASGSGNIVGGSQPQDLHPGSAVAIPAQPNIAIENTSSAPLVFRAYLFIAE